MRAACFPAGAEQADPAGLARAAALAPVAQAYVAPCPAATRTAESMGAVPVVVDALAEADYGRWRGLPYAEIAEREPGALAQWLADPDAAPHGGESLAAHAERVAAWLGSEPGHERAVVVCDAGTIRAALGHALGLGPLSCARFDLAPLSTTELAPARGGWRVAHVNRKVLP